jgi:FkbM family methyltransferase
VLGRRTIAMAPRGGGPPLFLRPGSSDFGAYDKVMREEGYHFTPRTSPTVIVDAGANVGMASVYFARKFPGARVIAIEPERSNFELLRRNVKPYPNVEPFLGALWSESLDIEIVDPGLGNQGFQVKPDIGGGVPALSVVDLMKRFDLGHIDILKIDIEGAEREVMGSSDAWIGKVGAVIAELHDAMSPGASRSFYDATKGFDWEWVRGENVFAVRERCLPSDLPAAAARIRRG